MKREQQDKLDELKEKGITVYSISRLNTYHTCKYSYFKTYIEGNKGENNIYSILGGDTHDTLEDIYNNRADKVKLIKMLQQSLNKCKIMDIPFPNEKIEVNWVEDMTHFVNNFSKIDLKSITEQHFIFEILPNIWIQGYIDIIFANGESILIVDWKTSSEFKGEKLLEAGRQLVLYKIAIEQITGQKVDKVAWFMTKYVNVLYNGKSKMCSRRKWVKDISKMLTTDLKKLKQPEFISAMMIETAINNNNLDNMPQEVKDKYKIEDCLLYYDVTEDKISELKTYISNTVHAIENEQDWNPVVIDKDTSFFCNILCNHRKTCSYLQEYNKQFIKNDVVDDIMNLF